MKHYGLIEDEKEKQSGIEEKLGRIAEELRIMNCLLFSMTGLYNRKSTEGGTAQ